MAFRCCFIDFIMICFVFFFFKQKTAYEMRISDWSSDVCSSDLIDIEGVAFRGAIKAHQQHMTTAFDAEFVVCGHRQKQSICISWTLLSIDSSSRNTASTVGNSCWKKNRQACSLPR